MLYQYLIIRLLFLIADQENLANPPYIVGLEVVE